MPVISAVGHEVDVTIADLVADVRAATPSVAAETVVQDGAALEREFSVMRNRMGNAAKRRLKFATSRLDAAQRDMTNGIRTALRRRTHRLGGAAGKLQALSPLSALARGYSVALDQAGHVLRSTANFRALNNFELRVIDGSIDCTVDAITEEHAE